MLDPRHRNVFHNTSSLDEFVDAYIQDFSRGLKAVDVAALAQAITAIQTAIDNGKRLYVVGNGGSAAIADHLVCDFAKGTDTEGHPALAVQSLASAPALISALANDFGLEHVFAKQVGYFCQPQDVLIAISSSGNSANIINAVTEAKSRDVAVVGLSGFAGGKLAELADIPLYVPVDNYAVVEDCHQSLMHVITLVIARRREGTLGW
ncbi:SIS domain-containing protein [Epibacterium sp. SM1969]|uniref:SIS domain-containing protein n=1 Tax=Tritonibacter aquimaris TaxID=2663379 RepID=A0A844ANH6_9RHOB|nr:SIS domain-containing protein [Tritonibacter aquimaris]MQY44165.1 SIS domain-containing protein [Tritonibacter aquimaris]